MSLLHTHAGDKESRPLDKGLNTEIRERPPRLKIGVTSFHPTQKFFLIPPLPPYLVAYVILYTYICENRNRL